MTTPMPDTVLVPVSRELIEFMAELPDGWSAPVQVRIDPLPDGTYTMTARRVQVEASGG